MLRMNLGLNSLRIFYPDMEKIQNTLAQKYFWAYGIKMWMPWHLNTGFPMVMGAFR